MSGRHIFISDVHGCFKELLNLLHECQYDDKKNDILVFVGDLVGKGPQSGSVVRFVMNQKNAKCVMGNWEYNLIRNPDMLKREARFFPLEPEAEREFSATEMAWIASLPYYLTFPEYNIVVVHAGLVPGRALDQQRPLDMISMRNLLRDGSTCSKTTVGSPWIESWRGPEFVIFGHDARRGLQRTPVALGLDTACVYGNLLSAWIVPDNQLVQVPALQRYAGKREQEQEKQKKPDTVLPNLFHGSRALRFVLWGMTMMLLYVFFLRR